MEPSATVDLSEPGERWTQFVLGFGDQAVNIHQISLDGHHPTMIQPNAGRGLGRLPATMPIWPIARAFSTSGRSVLTRSNTVRPGNCYEVVPRSR